MFAKNYTWYSIKLKNSHVLNDTWYRIKLKNSHVLNDTRYRIKLKNLVTFSMIRDKELNCRTVTFSMIRDIELNWRTVTFSMIRDKELNWRTVTFSKNPKARQRNASPQKEFSFINAFVSPERKVYLFIKYLNWCRTTHFKFNEKELFEINKIHVQLVFF